MASIHDCIERNRSWYEPIDGVLRYAVIPVVLTTIAILGMTGVVPGGAVGGTTLGMSGLASLLLVAGRCKKRPETDCIMGITAIALMIIGLLGATGVLSGVASGATVFSITSSAGACLLLFAYCMHRKRFHAQPSYTLPYNFRVGEILPNARKGWRF